MWKKSLSSLIEYWLHHGMGDNEFGQMGNKKRSIVMTPIVLKDFAGKKVLGIFAGDNKSGVIVES